MDYYVLDRFEGGFAICERPDGSFQELAREWLPAQAAEGDLLFQENGQWKVDQQATQARRNRLLEKRNLLRKKQFGD